MSLASYRLGVVRLLGVRWQIGKGDANFRAEASAASLRLTFFHPPPLRHSCSLSPRTMAKNMPAFVFYPLNQCGSTPAMLEPCASPALALAPQPQLAASASPPYCQLNSPPFAMVKLPMPSSPSLVGPMSVLLPS